MRGTTVTVKLHDGSVVERVLWEETPDRVFVTSAENYQKLLRGERDAVPIGFPRKDVGLPIGNHAASTTSTTQERSRFPRR